MDFNATAFPPEINNRILYSFNNVPIDPTGFYKKLLPNGTKFWIFPIGGTNEGSCINYSENSLAIALTNSIYIDLISLPIMKYSFISSMVVIVHKFLYF